MYTVHSDELEWKPFPSRSIKVMSDELHVQNLTFGLALVPPHSEMIPHDHVQEEVIFVLEGRGFVSVGGVKEAVRPGTFVHFPSGVEHFTCNESDEPMRFSFSFSPPVVVGSYDRTG